MPGSFLAEGVHKHIGSTLLAYVHAMIPMTNLDNRKIALSIKFLSSIVLDGNNLSNLDTCTFYGLSRSISHSPLHIHLRSNQFKTLYPCTFINFARSTIHVENNPLICNCSFNYLLHNRKSLAYTGQECHGGFASQSQTQLLSAAVHRISEVKRRRLIDNSPMCQSTYEFYDKLCSKVDCTNICSSKTRLIIQVTTVATPNTTQSKFQPNFPLFFLIIPLYVMFKK